MGKQTGYIFYQWGKKLRSVRKKAKKYSLDSIRSKLSQFQATDEVIAFEQSLINKFIKFNSKHLQNLLYSKEKDSEGFFKGAEPFIQEIIKTHENRVQCVSFSGGKDSTVVSQLVTKTLNNPSVLHIFGDTTLEFPETYEYLEDFMCKNSNTPFFVEKNESSEFMDICNKIGPPSRVKSWCCSIFKTGPMGTTLAEMNANILTFYGVRRHESASRSKYLKVSQSPKIKKQIVASPIIDWLDIDVWLYILTEKIDFNISYRRGFTRVGCWCCPNNSDWSDFLNSIYNVNNYTKWHNFLLKFAQSIGKIDFEEYINSGNWKARQGGDGLENSFINVNSKTCKDEESAKTFSLTRPIDNDFFELLKPFGNLNYDIGRKNLGEVFVVDNDNNLLMKITGKIGSNQVRIAILSDLTTIYSVNNINNTIFNYIERQIRKFQSCIYCKACDSSCPVSAINVSNSVYKVDENKCVNCLKCLTHFNKGCLIASALVTKNRNSENEY